MIKIFFQQDFIGYGKFLVRIVTNQRLGVYVFCNWCICGVNVLRECFNLAGRDSWIEVCEPRVGLGLGLGSHVRQPKEGGGETRCWTQALTSSPSPCGPEDVPWAEAMREGLCYLWGCRREERKMAATRGWGAAFLTPRLCCWRAVLMSHCVLGARFATVFLFLEQKGFYLLWRTYSSYYINWCIAYCLLSGYFLL